MPFCADVKPDMSRHNVHMCDVYVRVRCDSNSGSYHIASSDWEHHILNSIDCFYGTSCPFLKIEAPGHNMFAEPKKTFSKMQKTNK